MTSPSIEVADQAMAVYHSVASRIDAAGLRSVGFTSSIFGEGASTIALGTALALAALRQETVLLIDANWVQPSLTSDAHMESVHGLADYLANRADASAITRTVGSGRLAFVPIGDRAVARPTRRALSALLVKETAAFATVVVDLPPVLAGEDFVVPWSSVLDRLFVVVREAVTPLALVREAVQRLTVATKPEIVLNGTAARLPVAGARE
jgi:Mrp family chromosome partitioning ATPase